MEWVVFLTPEFEAWLATLPHVAVIRIGEKIIRPEELGPRLGRPDADTIKGSAVANLKELRVQVQGSPYRVFYAFDPIRRAVVLCGGDKSGDGRFYDRMIPAAEAIYARHLRDLESEQGG